MDYKEKYEQAIENIKKIKAANKDNKELVDFIEYKYPELKESEDERIKEDIISLINVFWERIGSINPEYSSRSEMLAWLEKQRKQETTTGMTYREIFPKFSVGDTLYRQGYANHTVRKLYVDNFNTTYICENDEGLESHIEISEQEKWYKIEKKPTWSEADEKERKRVVGLLEGWLSTFKDTCYAEDCKCGISWLKSLKQRMKGE